MRLCVAADGDLLGHRGDPSFHDCHAACHPLPHTWHHEVHQRKLILKTTTKEALSVLLIIPTKTLHHFSVTSFPRLSM